MRAAVILTLALPLLLDCGSKGDLFIGELTVKSTAGTGTMLPNAGSDAAPTVAGTSQGAVSGSDSAGSQTEGGTNTSGSGGEAGATEPVGGAPAGGCSGGEEPPASALVHRYDFSGTGTTVIDSVGGANGKLVGGASLDGSGVLALPGNRDGQADQYLDLPNRLVSPLTEVTIVAWTTWLGGAGYQRVFDFGVSDLGEKQGNSGKSYIAVMPSTGFANGTGLGAEVAAPGAATLQLPSPQMMNNRPAQVAFSFKSGESMELLLDGVSLIKATTSLELANIDDVNDWVGESQWSKDHAYHGTFDELRIYSVALNACQLHTLLVRGPDAP